MLITQFHKTVLNIQSLDEFNACAMELFHFQSTHNNVYRNFLEYTHCDPKNIHSFREIPCLPISVFKMHKVVVSEVDVQSCTVFTSSGTTGDLPSRHFVPDTGWYESVFVHTFQRFYGSPKNYRLLALLPAYLERTGSSLVYMANKLIDETNDEGSGFFLNDFDGLYEAMWSGNRPVILLGVTFALLDFADYIQGRTLPKNLLVMETGGMKGRREEMTRSQVHQCLAHAYGVNVVHSEYGMTELMSQAYSKGAGRFECPPWMKILTREVHDPKALCKPGNAGKIKVFDLANVHSCAFIETDDLGLVYDDGSFEVTGRLDNSDLRGCNLMVV